MEVCCEANVKQASSIVVESGLIIDPRVKKGVCPWDRRWKIVYIVLHVHINVCPTFNSIACLEMAAQMLSGIVKLH